MAETAVARPVWWRRVLPLLLLGALGVSAGLAQAPTEYWWVMPLALALLFAVIRVRDDIVACIFWFAFGYFAFALRWIVEPFQVDAEAHGWMAPFAIVLMAAGAASFWAVFVWGFRKAFAGSFLAVPAGILAAEICRSLVFTGFPWALVGHVLIPTPLAQLAAWGGPHFLTLIVLATAVAIVGLRDKPLLAAPVLVAVAVAWVAVQPPPAGEGGPVMRVVQPNVAQEDKWDRSKQPAYFARMRELTAAGEPPDFVALPESALPVLLEDAQAAFSALAVSARGAPVLTGVNRRDGTTYFTSATLIGAGGEALTTYDKAHLAPFGEYIPFGEWLGVFGLQGLAASQGGGFTAGPGDHLIDIPGVGAARVLICYEGIFAEEVAIAGPRPRLMVLITNDAWFGQGAGPTQHFAQARLRAIEQGLPLVRSANTGISGIIDPYGRVVVSLPLGVAGYVDAPLPEALEPTFYSRWGDLPMLLVLVLAAGLLWRATSGGSRVTH